MDNNVFQVIIESDSITMVQILKGEWKVPWSMTMVVNSIKRLCQVISVRVQHSLREGNVLANFFANLVFVFAGNFQINSF